MVCAADDTGRSSRTGSQRNLMQWRKLFCISLEEQKQEHICESPTLGMMYVPSSHSSENVDLKEDHGRRMLYAFEIRCCRELLNIR